VLAPNSPEISCKACGNTREDMSKAEGKEIPLISEAKIVKSGVVRVMELQDRAGLRQAVRRRSCTGDVAVQIRNRDRSSRDQSRRV
jgi:hypothetical protein